MITDKEIKALSKYGWKYTPGILRRTDDENIVITDLEHIGIIAKECVAHKKNADDKAEKESKANIERKKRNVLFAVGLFFVIIVFSIFL